MRRFPGVLSLRLVCALILVCAFGVSPAYCQEPPSPSAKAEPKSAEASEKPPELPAQIELLGTRVRFEANGDSRKEVHTRVHINNELGARQFARLAFDYNRSFQQIEFPLVRVTHTGGGTVDILPSAISDQPNPAVINAPAYQDVRVKSVRILGLTPNDLLEYRVVITTSHYPLAPDFWLDHTFDRSGVVSKEIFDLDVPATSKIQLKNPAMPVTSGGRDIGGVLCSTRCVYHWERTNSAPTAVSDKEPLLSEPDIALTTFTSWQQLAIQLAKLSEASTPVAAVVYERASALVRANDPSTANSYNPGPKIEALYDFVSQKIRTVDLALGSTGFSTRAPEDILSSGYGTQEDKFLLCAALARDIVTLPHAGFISSAMPKESVGLARPTVFDHILTEIAIPSVSWWVDLSLEVAPYGMIPSQFRGKRALLIDSSTQDIWRGVPPHLPFAAKQKVGVEATLSADGKLTAKVHYAMRGDNELLLRVAFHQSPKEKWKDVAQLLALSDGFRGKIINVTASDPYATKEPFTVEYEITQPKFVDWSKKPVRIPALLPQLGLPDPPAKPASGPATPAIDLGTPLDVETHLTLHLPARTTAGIPTGTSVERDYATFASKYQASAGAITAERHLNFLLREISAGRAADYTAFVHAVQSDEAQEFTLERPGTPLTAESAKPAVAASPSKPKQSPPKR